MIKERVRYLGAAPSADTTLSVRCRLRRVARARACAWALTWFVCLSNAEGVLEPDGLEGGGGSVAAVGGVVAGTGADAAGSGFGSSGWASGSSFGRRDSVEPRFRMDRGLLAELDSDT